MKQQIHKFLANKYVDTFLIGLILLNFIVFIFQTDVNFYNSYKIYIAKFELVSIIIFTIEYVLRIISLEKLKDIAKLARYTTALERMKKAFLKRKDEIIVTAMLFLIGLTIASILIYFAENQTGNKAFSSIPSAFWWAVVTFTSVGYGDTYPVTTIGKFIGAFTAIMGVGLHALLIGVVGAAFIDATKKN